jgi:hypothetical protein
MSIKIFEQIYIDAMKIFHGKFHVATENIKINT